VDTTMRLSLERVKQDSHKNGIYEPKKRILPKFSMESCIAEDRTLSALKGAFPSELIRVLGSELTKEGLVLFEGLYGQGLVLLVRAFVEAQDIQGSPGGSGEGFRHGEADLEIDGRLVPQRDESH